MCAHAHAHARTCVLCLCGCVCAYLYLCWNGFSQAWWEQNFLHPCLQRKGEAKTPTGQLSSLPSRALEGILLKPYLLTPAKLIIAECTKAEMTQLLHKKHPGITDCPGNCPVALDRVDIWNTGGSMIEFIKSTPGRHLLQIILWVWVSPTPSRQGCWGWPQMSGFQEWQLYWPLIQEKMSDDANRGTGQPSLKQNWTDN